MAFPGRHASTKYSFDNPKGMAKEHEVTNPPRAYPFKELTMAKYSNIEHGEMLGERNERAPHIHHEKGPGEKASLGTKRTSAKY
jgi:hypothetical protein